MTMTVCQEQCPICKGEGGSYEPCGEDYSMMWLRCQECDGEGIILVQRHGERHEAEKTK